MSCLACTNKRCAVPGNSAKKVLMIKHLLSRLSRSVLTLRIMLLGCTTPKGRVYLSMFLVTPLLTLLYEAVGVTQQNAYHVAPFIFAMISLLMIIVMVLIHEEGEQVYAKQLKKVESCGRLIAPC